MTRPSLAGIEQRTAAATEGPWEVVGPSSPGPYNDLTIVPLSEVGAVAYVQPLWADAAFIAAARTAVPALTAAVRDVLALHRPQPYGREGDPPFVPRLACDHCLAQHDGAVEYPCPTVRALTAHLDLTDTEGDPT